MNSPVSMCDNPNNAAAGGVEPGEASDLRNGILGDDDGAANGETCWDGEVNVLARGRLEPPESWPTSLGGVTTLAAAAAARRGLFSRCSVELMLTRRGETTLAAVCRADGVATEECLLCGVGGACSLANGDGSRSGFLTKFGTTAPPVNKGFIEKCLINDNGYKCNRKRTSERRQCLHVQLCIFSISLSMSAVTVFFCSCFVAAVQTLVTIQPLQLTTHNKK